MPFTHVTHMYRNIKAVARYTAPRDIHIRRRAARGGSRAAELITAATHKKPKTITYWTAVQSAASGRRFRLACCGYFLAE